MKPFLTCMFMILALICEAQIEKIEENRRVMVELNDGSVIYGYIGERSDGKITVITDNLGNLAIDLKTVRKLDVIRTEKEDTDPTGFPVDYHNSTHYTVSPSAYGLKKGQSYYENIYIFWNSYTTGITDNFSISLGGEIASLLFAGNFPVVFFSPKYSLPFRNGKGAFAFGGTVFTAPESDFTSFGFLTGSLTLGSRNNNITFGSGTGWGSNDGFENSFVPFNISGMFRIGPRMSFITENWLIFENDFTDELALMSAGLRIHFKNSGSAFNAGIWRSLEDQGDVIAIPYVSATIAVK